ncbi:GNAT family N-acetyltransferase [Ornithinimicrobium tianjinense]|uniref:GNAT family N-acetyltransferase n=1 Tax=Ornithinimicrobium tianjinense TaxID=1195761 RepID=UPI0016637E0E|nr:GNAT family N-acetyltransferase [Ornithinimicrobium tianjinense]
METTVRKHTGPEGERFEIVADGEVAGFAMFVDVEGRRVFFHTEIGPEFGGKGLATVLVRHALEKTSQEGLRIVAVCPFVKKYVNTHTEEWASHVDAATPPLLAAIPRSHG